MFSSISGYCYGILTTEWIDTRCVGLNLSALAFIPCSVKGMSWVLPVYNLFVRIIEWQYEAVSVSCVGCCVGFNMLVLINLHFSTSVSTLSLGSFLGGD